MSTCKNLPSTSFHPVILQNYLHYIFYCLEFEIDTFVTCDRHDWCSFYSCYEQNPSTPRLFSFIVINFVFDNCIWTAWNVDNGVSDLSCFSGQCLLLPSRNLIRKALLLNKYKFAIALRMYLVNLMFPCACVIYILSVEIHMYIQK